MRLLKRQSTDAVQRDQKATDDALMQAYKAAVALETEKREEGEIANDAFNEIEKTARGQVMVAAQRQGKTYVAAQVASAAATRLRQQVRSSDAVDPLVREGGPVITDLCTADAHVVQHGRLKLGEDRAAIRDFRKLGIESYTTYPSGVVSPMGVELGRLERVVPLADWAEKHHPAFVSALEAIRSLQLVRGVDFAAAVTGVYNTLPQRCTCGHDFALEVPTLNATEAA